MAKNKNQQPALNNAVQQNQQSAKNAVQTAGQNINQQQKKSGK